MPPNFSLVTTLKSKIVCDVIQTHYYIRKGFTHRVFGLWFFTRQNTWLSFPTLVAKPRACPNDFTMYTFALPHFVAVLPTYPWCQRQDMEGSCFLAIYMYNQSTNKQTKMQNTTTGWSNTPTLNVVFSVTMSNCFAHY